MTEPNWRRATLEEIRAMKDRGEVHTDPGAPEGPPPGEELPEGFWDNAQLVQPQDRRSVHLKLDSEVFDYFFSESGGKGHITKMQNVLKAYVNAHKGR